jgi:Flp pilus assembly protein TadG
VSSPGVPARARRDRESGQATVEFALILFPLMIVVAGIIYFGIGLNYWLDMNRVANQGARQAAVNHWGPQCPRGETSCSNFTSTTACSTVMGTSSPWKTNARLQDVLRCQTRNNAKVSICYPADANPNDATIGDPVKVRVSAPYTFFFINSLKITLSASATMRLEQAPTLLTNETGGPQCP